MRKRKTKKKRQVGKPQRSQLGSLAARLEQGPFRGMKFVKQPTGVEKMSEVLSAFVEPYADQATTKDAYSKLLTLGILAWNASLNPEPKRTAMIDEALRSGRLEISDDVADGLHNIVKHLIARKEACFASNRRIIVDFELTDLGDEWRLNVASIMDPS